MSSLRRFFSVIIACASLVSCAFAAPFYLKSGDRVVFYGDSITDWRLYTTYVETFVATRLPELDVTFTHSGWGGDTVRGGPGGDIGTRLERDVFAHDPSVVTIMLGMNDGARRPFDTDRHRAYRDGLASIVEKIQSRTHTPRLTLIQPSPYDDITRAPDFPGGYNQTLVRYGETVAEIADRASARSPVLSADFNTAVVEMLRKAAVADPALAQKIIPDRVHPRNGGHLVMATALLQAWNAPATVSTVEIDATARRLLRAENTRVDGLLFPAASATASGITWTQLDAALPFPVDADNAELMLAVKTSGFHETLNRQILRVAGLASSVRLTIDDTEIGVFTPEQLAAGVNLAALKTPMSEQAARVHRLTVERVSLRHMRWRTFQVPYADVAGKDGSTHYAAILRQLDSAATDVAALRKVIAQPLPRRYALVPLTSTTRPAAPAVALPEEGDSIQPRLSSFYGNSIELESGSGLIFGAALDRRAFVGKLYAADAQREDLITWQAGNTDHRPLSFGNTKWNGQSSLTWKFTAPAGKKFSGGRLEFQGATIWKNAGLVLRTHSRYADYPEGNGGYSPHEGDLYDEDARTGVAPWQWTTWSVAIPQGVSEFYLTITKEQPWIGAWGNHLRADSVVLDQR